MTINSQTSKRRVEKKLIHLELQRTEATTTNNAYQLLDTSFFSWPGALYLSNPKVKEIRFEALLKTTRAGGTGNEGTAYADLYNTTAAASITSSEVSTIQSSYVESGMVRSIDIKGNMPSGTATLQVRIKNGVSGETVTICWARLIVIYNE